MATRLPDDSIRMDDGRIIFANTLVMAQDVIELVPLFMPPPVWPFVSGGGGGGGSVVGSQGPAGAAGGPQGSLGAQGSQGAQGFQGNQGRQGNQGNQGTQASDNMVITIFTVTHTSGTFSTGPLGFNPKFAIMSCSVQNDAGATQGSFTVGFTVSTGAAALAAGIGIVSDPTPLVGGKIAGDINAIGGAIVKAAAFGVTSQTTFDNDLDVTAFSAANISLTWSAPVTAHQGVLFVLGFV